MRNGNLESVSDDRTARRHQSALQKKAADLLRAEHVKPARKLHATAKLARFKKNEFTRRGLLTSVEVLEKR